MKFEIGKSYYAKTNNGIIVWKLVEKHKSICVRNDGVHGWKVGDIFSGEQFSDISSWKSYDTFNDYAELW